MATFEEAMSYHRNGQLEAAEKAYTEILKVNPQDANAMNLFGVLLIQAKRFPQATELLKKAVDINPCLAFLENLGLSYFCSEDFENALKCYEKAFEFGFDAEITDSIVMCYEMLDRHENKLKYLLMLHEHDPKNLVYIRKLAKVYGSLEQPQKSLEFYNKSLAIEPDDHIALNNIGLIYQDSKDYKNAKQYFLKSLKVKPNYEAYYNLGVLTRKECSVDEAINYLQKALELEPTSTQAKVSLGIMYYEKKDILNGFKYYSQRKPDVKARYKNHWNGEKHPESSVLVYYDSGFGDNIMFSRYLNYLKGYFKEVKLYTNPQLLSLFRLNFPDMKVYPEKEVIEYDYAVNIMELPYYLKMDFHNIPSAPAYLKVDENRRVKLKEKYFNYDKRKIGLFWQGNPRVFKNRSIKLEQLRPLLNLPDTYFYSFQKEDSLNQIRSFRQITDLELDLYDFLDTASALMSIDLLITIDTAIAHLAGALGVKTYLLLPYDAEWRWFNDTKTTPWYDSVRVFRQGEPDNWDKVVQEVYANLVNR